MSSSSSSKPPKKVHYTPSTKGSSVVGDRPTPSSSSSRPPVSSSATKPPSTRRPSISIHTTSSTRPQAPDSGVGSSNASTSSTSSPIPIPVSTAQQQQHRNVNELYLLKDRVQSLERENRQLSNDLQESNREKQQMRREQERMLRKIEELEGKVKERVRDDRDGIRVRGGNIPIPSSTEKKDRERVPVTVERNTPPMTRRERERDSEARRIEEERLRTQQGTRERRTSFIPPSPSYRERQFEFDDEPNLMRGSYRDDERRSPPARDPNPFAPAPAASRARRTSVSYGSGSSGGYPAPQGYPPKSLRSVFGGTSEGTSGVPYIRGEVEVRSPASSVSGRVIGDAEDDLYPVDGKYHLYPL